MLVFLSPCPSFPPPPHDKRVAEERAMIAIPNPFWTFFTSWCSLVRPGLAMVDPSSTGESDDREGERRGLSFSFFPPSFSKATSLGREEGRKQRGGKTTPGSIIGND